MRVPLPNLGHFVTAVLPEDDLTSDQPPLPIEVSQCHPREACERREELTTFEAELKRKEIDCGTGYYGYRCARCMPRLDCPARGIKVRERW